MSGSEQKALQARAMALHGDMLRVLRSDPSPRHKNTDTRLREDTRGWGPPAPLNPRLPEPAFKGGSQPDKVNGFKEACADWTTPH